MLTGKMVRIRYARDRLVPLYLEVRDPQWHDVGEQLIALFNAMIGQSREQLETEADERFGDFVIRAGYVAQTTNGLDFHANSGPQRA